MKTLKNLIALLLCVVVYEGFAQKDATLSEVKQIIKTYPFSDPNPIPQPESYFYPYYRFDGFALDAEDKEWNIVVLENDYIQVSVFPEIGGKIWGAIEKSTGNEFIYYNSVVKFRDIAMRGAWTSGGIELNFGVIGHAPTCATPVDYLTRENEDGSVSCFVSANDLFTRTRWETEINLEKDKAYFTTTTTWYNTTPLVQPYYQWMNAAYQVNGDLEFCFPGGSWIGHDGQAHDWPIDNEGRDISWYKNNSFGGSKSNHVLGGISDHYAGYWHDLEFGSGHFSPYGEKLGMKVFQWAHSRSGGIWEDLLTDNDGQYVELQSGRLFNQAATNSTKTPFKHFGFEPYSTDVFKEHWFPILKTKGVKKANPYGIINIEKEGDELVIYFCPLQKTDELIRIYFGEELFNEIPVNLNVLETWSEKIKVVDSNVPIKVVLGDNKLIYSEKKEENITNRPMDAPKDFDWDSSFGLFLDGQQWLYQNKFELAEESFKKCLEKDAYYMPALNQVAALCYRKADYEDGLVYASKSLSINTYDAEANFIYALNNKKLERLLDAQDGFSVASLTPSYRTSACIELSKLALLRADLTTANSYAEKVIKSNPNHIEGNKLMAVIKRQLGNADDALIFSDQVESIAHLNHFSSFERLLLTNDIDYKEALIEGISSELPEQTFMEMAQWYQDIGSINDAIQLLELAPKSVMVLVKLAYLQDLNGSDASKKLMAHALELTPDFVLPFRPENKAVLEWAVVNTDHWKPKYYLALLNWRFGNTDKAMNLFSQCKSQPDVAAFYLAKSELFSNQKGYDPQEDLITARSLAPDDWRASSRLIEYYLSQNQAKKALEIAKESIKIFPSNNLLKYTYAKSLMANSQYTDCKHALAKTVILPSEGARYGRVTYRQACLMEGIEYYKKGRYNSAIKSITSAKLWPENLGVGKPFVVDERIEHFFEAICLKEKGDSERADQLFQQVITDTNSLNQRHSSVDYLYLMSLNYLQNGSEAISYLEKWENIAPEDPIQKWCNSMITGDLSQAGSIAEEINIDAGGTPWDPKFADPEFEIVKSIGNVISKNP